MRRDVFLGIVRSPEAQNRTAVDVHGACTTLSAVAPFFGAGQRQLFAQHIEKRHAQLDRNRASITIDCEMGGHKFDARVANIGLNRGTGLSPSCSSRPRDISSTDTF
jgi:hypothetical protein